jgi:hypothetical protein
MERVMHLFPRQGDREPWVNPQNYAKDRRMFLHGELEDGALMFTTAGGAATGQDAAAEQSEPEPLKRTA